MMVNLLTHFTPTFLYMANNPKACAFLDFIFCMTTCIIYRNDMRGRKQPWLQTLLSCLLGCFGGTVLTSLALGIPILPLSTMNSPLAFLAAWWLIFCAPGDLMYSLFTTFPFLMIFLDLINCVSAGHAVTTWGADKALSNVHLLPNGSGPLTILAGTLSACGGGIISLWFGITGSSPDWTFRTPPTLQKPSIIVKNAFFSSVLYYIMRNPHASFPWRQDLIPKGEASVVIWLLWTTVLLLTSAGITDPYKYVSDIFGAVTFIPASVPRGGRPYTGYVKEEEESYVSSPQSPKRGRSATPSRRKSKTA